MQLWSPDGTKIAFVSNHDKDPDRTENTDVFVADARPGATPRKLTNYPGPDSGPISWSADSKLIAYLQGSESKFTAYSMNRLAVVTAQGGASRVLTQKLDRGVSFPVFTDGAASITFLVADDRSEYPAKIAATGGAVERLTGAPIVVSALSTAGGHTAALSASDNAPPEVFALEGGSLRKLTRHNDDLVSQLQLGAVEDISFESRDGTEVHGLLTKPPSYENGKKVPMLLRIHGGPNGQDAHAFSFERQFFAANGYAVIAVNYRGSAGRGEKYGQSIFGDWGDKEVADLLAGVDHVVNIGVADPNRLGIGGWSYGGILTDYTIASDQRFKAAISGAGSALQLSMYGVDQYTFQYDNELGSSLAQPRGLDEGFLPLLQGGPDSHANIIYGRRQRLQCASSSAASRCIRLFEPWGFRRSSSFIPASSTVSPDPALSAIAMSAISPGTTNTSSCLPQLRFGSGYFELAG